MMIPGWHLEALGLQLYRVNDTVFQVVHISRPVEVAETDPALNVVQIPLGVVLDGTFECFDVVKVCARVFDEAGPA